jgi:hypothetical protein
MKEHPVPDSRPEADAKRAPAISQDTWAVILALAAAALIRLGVIPRVPW